MELRCETIIEVAGNLKQREPALELHRWVPFGGCKTEAYVPAGKRTGYRSAEKRRSGGTEVIDTSTKNILLLATMERTDGELGRKGVRE